MHLVLYPVPLSALPVLSFVLHYWRLALRYVTAVWRVILVLRPPVVL